MRKPHNFGILLFTVFLLCTQNGYAQTVNLNSPTILGELKLPGAQLESIKEAVEKALSGNIDTEYQCGEVKLDCVVRAARQWNYEGSTLREIVVNIHTVGHASFTVEKPKGKSWPTIAVNSTREKKSAKN